MRWTALVAGLALLLAACGDGGDSADGDGGGDGGGGTVEVAAVWSGDEQAAFQKVLDAFTEETGIETEFTSTGDDIATVLGSRISGDDPPDVAILPQPGLLKDLADQDALQPVEEVAGEAVDENYAKVWRELGTVDDQLYGVWFKAANKSTIWYRPPAFEEAGVEPPETWDQLVQISQTLSDAGTTPFAIGGGDGWTLTDWFENVYLRTAGPEKYDQLANHEIPWTDESVKTALTTLAEVFGKPTWLAGGASGALQTDFPGSVTKVFAEEEAAMVYEGDFVAGEITANTEAELGEGADFFPFPDIDDSGPAIVGGGDVAVLMSESEQGRELIEFLATPEAGQAWAEQGGFTSPNKNVDAEVYPDDITRRSAQELVGAESFRFDLSDLQPAAFGGTAGQGMWKLLQDFLQNPAQVDSITQQLEAAAAAAFTAAP
jgi:ABC-type Fe3+ transport system substrate-binding protein